MEVQGTEGVGGLLCREQAGPQHGGKTEKRQCVCYPICVLVEHSHFQMFSGCRKPVSELGSSTG